MVSCGYDFLKMEKLLKQNVVEWFTYLQYMKQKGEIEIFLRDTQKT